MTDTNAHHQDQTRVNPRLTATGRQRSAKPQRSTEDVIAMITRMLRAASRRVATEDMEQFELLLGLRHDLEAAISDAAKGLIENGGYSCQDLGDAVGISRQAAHAKWVRRRSSAA